MRPIAVSPRPQRPGPPEVPPPHELPRVPDDDLLLARARAGNDDALAELHRRAWPVAVAAARAVTRDHDRACEAAATAVADTVAALRGGGGPRASFAGYLAVSARRAARREAGHQPAPVAALPAGRWVGAATRPGADDPAELMADPVMVAAMARLPAPSQRLLWLTVIEGWRPRELAADPSAAAAIMAASYRARRALRRAYLALSPPPDG